MAEIHHFTYGWFNPIVAFLMAFLGSLLGLLCTTRARSARAHRRQGRWILIAAMSIGGAGIWLMHFMAMLGFDIPNGVVRYDPLMTVGSMLLAIVPVGAGLFMVVRGAATLGRILVGGLFTGLGVLAMHYTGMLGMRVAGTIHFDPGLFAASAIVAVVAATAALWFASAVTGWGRTLLAALVMGVAICGMHYTGMAALRIRLSTAPMEVTGISPFLLIVPITVLSAVAMVAMAVTALQTITEEEFDGAMSGRHRGAPGTPVGPGVPAGGHPEPVTPDGPGRISRLTDVAVRSPLRGGPTASMPVVTPTTPFVQPADQGMARTF